MTKWFEYGIKFENKPTFQKWKIKKKNQEHSLILNENAKKTKQKITAWEKSKQNIHSDT